MPGMVTVQEVQGDQSETSVKLVFEDKAAIPGFDTQDNTPVSAYMIDSGVQGLKWLLLGAQGGPLQLPDEELVGDLDTQSGELEIEKADLGEAFVAGTQLPYTQFTHRGTTYTQVMLSEPEAPEAPAEPSPI